MNYTDFLLKNENYKNEFEKEWNLELTKLDIPVALSNQMKKGNRLRPILFAWGYALSSPVNNLSLNKIAKMSIGIEMVHKASIIVDDIVDDDDYRNGETAFHVEHSINEGIVFSNFLVNKSIAHFKNELIAADLSFEEISKNTTLLSNTISNMTRGCLFELTLEKTNTYDNTNIITEILDLETTSLIRDSLLLGYLSNHQTKDNIYNCLENIGYTYGHIFQLLNDLEPFNKNKFIINHKNKFSLDTQRKNIALSILKRKCNAEELYILNNLDSSEEGYNIILELLDKYNIRKTILNDIDYLITKLTDSYNDLEKYNKTWTNNFKEFQSFLMDYALNRI